MDRERERGGGSALRDAEDELTPLEALPHRMPRGPPGVRVLVGDGPVPGVVAFGWSRARRRGDHAAGAGRGRGHIEAGRVTERWWHDLLRHELDFHIDGAEHTGHRHDADAERMVARLALARRLEPGTSRGMPRRAAGSLIELSGRPFRSTGERAAVGSRRAHQGPMGPADDGAVGRAG
jgi:hypothetical protein